MPAIKHMSMFPGSDEKYVQVHVRLFGDGTVRVQVPDEAGYMLTEVTGAVCGDIFTTVEKYLAHAKKASIPQVTPLESHVSGLEDRIENLDATLAALLESLRAV